MKINQIIEACFDESGKIKSPNHTKESYLRNNGFYDDIMNLSQQLDNKESLGSRLKYIKAGCPERKKCLACEKPTHWLNQRMEFNNYCSRKCANETKNRSPEFIERQKLGLQKVNNSQKQNRRKQTTLVRYGVDHINKRPDNEIRRNHFRKLNLDYDKFTNFDYLNEICSDCGSYNELSKKYMNGMSVDCIRIHFQSISFEPPYKRLVSYPHKQIMEILEKYDTEYQINDRELIKPQELDIFIPDRKLAIEINGLYFHSQLGRNYHLDKFLVCKENNIQLIQFWDLEIREKFPIVESIIKNKLGLNSNKVFARKTILKQVKYKDVKSFLDENHIQGSGALNTSVNLVLINDKEIVSCMTFSRSRYSRKHEWEMFRFCNKINTSVVGAATKLFTYFINTNSPKSIVTYSDRRLFDGKLYENLGFSISHSTAPQYWYFGARQDKLYHRMKFQKKNLPNLLKSFDLNKSEWENMRNNGYSRVFDCGNVVWIRNFLS